MIVENLDMECSGVHRVTHALAKIKNKEATVILAKYWTGNRRPFLCIDEF